MPKQDEAEAAVLGGAASADLALSQADYLKRLGERIRSARNRDGMTRKQLSRISGVSERYLAQLETGQGNISILLLRQVANAVSVPLDELVADEPALPNAFWQFRRDLRDASFDELMAVQEALGDIFQRREPPRRERRIALIGLRGAGKSTLGRGLAEALGLPFLELNREIEQESGLPVSKIFSLYGPEGYRRLEGRSLHRVVQRHDDLVMATGGGVVSDPENYDLLLSSCLTVWLKARPEEHMRRVLAQGDRRPFAGNEGAMEDLRLILASRESLYARADLVIDTSGQTIGQSLDALLAAVAQRRPGEGAVP